MVKAGAHVSSAAPAIRWDRAVTHQREVAHDRSEVQELEVQTPKSHAKTGQEHMLCNLYRPGASPRSHFPQRPRSLQEAPPAGVVRVQACAGAAVTEKLPEKAGQHTKHLSTFSFVRRGW